MPCAIHPEVVAGLTTCSRCNKSFCPNCIITLRGAAVCAGCKGAMVQDVKSGTVEGELDMAGRGARLGAAIIDGFVIGIPMMIIFVVAGFGIAGSGLTADGKTVSIPIWFTLIQYGLPLILTVVYEGWMLSTFNGKSLGKMALGIRVVAPDGSPLTSGQAWGRGLARALMNLTQILGLVDPLFIFSKARTTLHDRIAKTRVVRAKA
jgi:uncharacterized RDD family membrane protein YckC